MSHIIWNKKQICFPAYSKISTHILHIQTYECAEENEWGKRHQAWTAAESGIQSCSLPTTKESIHTRKAGTIIYLHLNALHVIIHYAKHDKQHDLVIFIYIIVVCQERAPFFMHLQETTGPSKGLKVQEHFIYISHTYLVNPALCRNYQTIFFYVCAQHDCLLELSDVCLCMCVSVSSLCLHVNCKAWIVCRLCCGLDLIPNSAWN